MDLTDDQKQAVRQWVADGLGLSDIQSKLSEAFDLSMTYMDVRFLVLDLGVEMKDKPTSQSAPPSDPHVSPDEPDSVVEADGTPAPDPLGSALGGSVSVEVSRVAKPGSLVSGTVTFSDGVTASWSLDQFGRLALLADREGYRPSEQDVQAFQVELRKTLETKGF